MNLSTILNAMNLIGPVTAALPAVKSLIEAGVALLSNKDQATAKEALEDLMADNDEGHRRLQEKLRIAATKGD